METLNVFFGQIRVGSLSIDDRRLFSFQYSKKWLTSPDAFQISISLPMQEDIFLHDKVKSFFSNLLPESAVRELIAKQLGISAKNDFMLLKRIGGERAGAITILPESEIPESPDQYTYRSLSDKQFVDLIKHIPRRPLLAGQEGIRISLAGAHTKVALFYKDPAFYIPINGASSNFILKPGMTHFQSSIENECFCMMLANAIDLNVPMRLHQEDFCQAMGLSQNLSFIYQAKQIRLAPFFDMMCTDIYEDLSQKLAMKIGGENRPEWIMEKHWKRFAEEIKISNAVLQKRLSDFCLKVTNKIDSTYTDFINRYQRNSLLEDIILAIKKRSDRMLKQFD